MPRVKCRGPLQPCHMSGIASHAKCQMQGSIAAMPHEWHGISCQVSNAGVHCNHVTCNIMPRVKCRGPLQPCPRSGMASHAKCQMQGSIAAMPHEWHGISCQVSNAGVHCISCQVSCRGPLHMPHEWHGISCQVSNAGVHCNHVTCNIMPRVKCRGPLQPCHMSGMASHAKCQMQGSIAAMSHEWHSISCQVSNAGVHCSHAT